MGLCAQRQPGVGIVDGAGTGVPSRRAKRSDGQLLGRCLPVAKRCKRPKWTSSNVSVMGRLQPAMNVGTRTVLHHSERTTA
jgi:hypothetical protein